jgi:hypothetical protein
MHPELAYGINPLPRDPSHRRHPESTYNINEVPLFPMLRAETHGDGRELRLSSTMTSNIQGLTNSLAESTGQYVAMLEQVLELTKGELDVRTQELAEAREGIDARNEQFRRMRAILQDRQQDRMDFVV